MGKTKKIESTEYLKIGRINMTRAKAAHIEAGDIKINKNHIYHVAGKHKAELHRLGLSSIDFIKMIVDNYNEIREAKNGAYYLGMYVNGDYAFTAIISLNYNEKKKFWEIKTAIPMRTAVFIKKTLIWKKGANPLK